MSERFVETDIGRFRVREWGERGQPVILMVHGFNQTLHSWDEVAPIMAEDAHVIAFDQRGHGESLRAPGDYGRQAMVDDIGRVADALAVEQIALVGMSMGAVHSIAFTSRYADRVRKLVVVDYAPRVETGGVDKIKLMLMRTWPSLDAAVAEVRMFNPRRTEANIRERLGHSLRQTEDGQWTWKVDMAFALERRFTQEEGGSMWEHVAAVQCAALLIRGGESDVLTDETAVKMRDTFRDGKLLTIEGAGHSVAGDRPEMFASAVGSFLK